MRQQRILIWYRNDLRVHDREAICHALGQKAEIIPVYCFDELQFSTTSFGFPKTGNFRAQFLIESVADLRSSLQKLGSNLIVRQGLPEKIIPAIAEQLEVDQVYYSREVTAEEKQVEQRVKRALSANKIKTKSFWESTLYLLEDLPFKISQIPELYTLVL